MKFNFLLNLFYRVRWALYLRIAKIKMYYRVLTATKSYVKFRYVDRHYLYSGGSDVKICVVGCFLSNDVQLSTKDFRESVLNGTLGGGNITMINQEGENVTLIETTHDQESGETPTEVTMTIQQFVQLLDDWDAKVCKLRPREVTIIYENDQYRIETKQ